MWTCPNCGRPFTRAHQSHSCGRFSVDAFLQGKSDEQMGLYRKFESLALSVGDVNIAPAKGRIGFQHGRIFAAVNAVNRNGIRVHIVTSTPIEAQRVARTEVLSEDSCVNHIALNTPTQVDGELRRWLQLGYEWGGKRLR